MVDDVFLVDLGFIRHLAGHRDAGVDDRLLRPRDERVPPGEVAAFSKGAVGTGGGQPLQARHIADIEADAVVDPGVAVGIIGAAAGGRVEQAAGQRRIVDFAGVLVLQLDQTTAAATIAKAFPLDSRHLR